MPNFNLALFLCTLLTIQVSAQESYWNIDEPLDSIPMDGVSGMLWGQPFALSKATFNDAALVLWSTPTAPSRTYDSYIAIFVDVVNGAGQWNLSPDTKERLPGVHVHYRKDEGSDVRILMLNYDYYMNLVIDDASAEQVSGKIHLSLPDYKHSYLVGSFTANRTVP